MAERLITVITAERVPDLLTGIDEAAVRSRWERRTEDDRYETTLLVEVGNSEAVMDALHSRFEGEDEYILVLLTVDASLPRAEEEEEARQEERAERDGGGAEQDETEEEKAARRGPPQRISRDELYNDVEESSSLTPRYLVMVALATVVAAAGMLRENVAVIIGAMVIAPLLGPNIALSLAVTLADAKLARRAFVTGLAGMAVALGLSVATGLAFGIDTSNPQIAARATVNLADLALALAAGAAGALAFTSGAPAGVIGVMVAVALLPPVVATGLLFANGMVVLGLAASLLVAVNLISINLAGVLTFLVQGLSPRDWRDEKAAKQATRVAIAIWITLLTALAAIVFWWGPEPL